MMNRRSPLSLSALVAVAASLWGCPGAEPEDDGGLDAGTADVPVLFDSGTDAGTEPDDAPLDTAPLDTDNDGVPDDEDCDPAAGTVGREGERPCTSECGVGTEACTDGVWAACDAPVDCLCATEGMRRVVPCGRCGEMAEECTEGQWEGASACLSEGECSVGDVETRAGTRCSEEQRLCNADCEWGEFTRTREPGECQAGLVECFPQMFSYIDYVCTDECVRVDNPCCPPMFPETPECDCFQNPEECDK